MIDLIDMDFQSHEHVHRMEFTAGEVNVNVSAFPKEATGIQIRMREYTSLDIMTLAMTVDAIRRHCYDLRELELYMPYLPFSRQDRVCNKGEALSIKVFAELINSLMFDRVVTLDAHSDVGPALIDRCVNYTQDEVLSKTRLGQELFNGGLQSVVLVSPDAGAHKKTFKTAMRAGGREIVKADKVRDTTDGSILSTSIDSTELREDRIYLVLDDICDGGRTFIELAKVLQERGARNLWLWVTHGIFSKGVKPLVDAGFNTIYTTDSFKPPRDPCGSHLRRYPIARWNVMS